MAVDCLKCKCWIRPFEPPEGCYDCCAGKILKYARPFELVEYFGVESKLAEKLFELSADNKRDLLSDYEPMLTVAEFNSIDFACRNISAKGWTWIQINLQLRMESGIDLGQPTYV